MELTLTIVLKKSTALYMKLTTIMTYVILKLV